MNKESQHSQLPINSVSKRLAGLDKTGLVMQTVKEREAELQQLIIGGYNQLITRFNQLKLEDPILGVMPKTKVLKEALQDVEVPTLEAVSPREILSGVNEARDAMLLGQEIKHGIVEATPDNVQKAIGTPSMETSNMALSVGTAGHVIERTLFSHFRKLGIRGIQEEWIKDDILFALEDCALLMHAEATNGLADEPHLLKFIARPNALDEEGGLGWRKPEQVQEFVQRYQMIAEKHDSPTSSEPRS